MRPFLKWAGGKRQLLPALRPCYPAAFNRYIEPFLGSGAVFFDLADEGRLEKRPAVLADLNADLIACYAAVRDETDAVIETLDALERAHRKRGAECYYEVRERFNANKAGGASRAGGAGRASGVGRGGADRAAMFIYLNRTGFNGLFRLNRAGAFNVPAGRYVNPRICDAEQGSRHAVWYSRDARDGKYQEIAADDAKNTESPRVAAEYPDPQTFALRARHGATPQRVSHERLGERSAPNAGVGRGWRRGDAGTRMSGGLRIRDCGFV